MIIFKKLCWRGLGRFFKFIGWIGEPRRDFMMIFLRMRGWQLYYLYGMIQGGGWKSGCHGNFDGRKQVWILGYSDYYYNSTGKFRRVDY